MHGLDLVMSGVTDRGRESGHRDIDAAGITHIGWPTKIVHAKIVVLGLDGAFARQ
jgi:hypothetical protein